MRLFPARASLACTLIALFAVAPAPARADDPTLLERVASVKRSPEGLSARLLDTPILQVLRVAEERVDGGHRGEVRVGSSRLFSLFRRDSSTTASGPMARTKAEGRFASLLGFSLFEWNSEKEHPIAGPGRTAESEWRLLSLPKLGSLFARRQTAAGSAYEVLYFLHFGDRPPDAEVESPVGGAPVLE